MASHPILGTIRRGMISLPEDSTFVHVEEKTITTSIMISFRNVGNHPEELIKVWRQQHSFKNCN